MKILICPDTFKGTLTAEQAASAIEKGISKKYPRYKIKKLPMADGGYGTLDVIHGNLKSSVIRVKVHGPLEKPVLAKYLILKNDTGLIEMAQAGGYTLLKKSQYNPMLTTTYGVGELILDAVKKGCKNIYITVGGSITNDGGMGMAQAIGVKFLDRKGKEVSYRKKEGYSGGSLEYIRRIDISRLNSLLKKTKFKILCDVRNILTGRHGASYTYGPQKGAIPEMVKRLDNALKKYAQIIKRELGVDISHIPGTGAAGGLPAGIVAFLKGDIVSGVDAVIKIVNFEKYIKNSDIIITGEGRIDGQTIYGKTISGITKIAKRHKVPVIAIGGSLGKDYKKAYKLGLDMIYDASRGRKYDIKTLKQKASSLLEKTASEIKWH